MGAANQRLTITAGCGKIRPYSGHISGSTKNAFKPLDRLPHVSTPRGITIPRAAAVAEAFLHAVQFQFDEHALVAYIDAYQQVTVLKFSELWALIPSLELVLLEQVAARGQRALQNPDMPQKVGVCVRSLRDISQLHWKDVLDPQVAFEKMLRADPAGAYSRMDFDSRDLYRSRLVKIAENSDSTEMEVAQAALSLAREAAKQDSGDPRLLQRQSHIGYYLVGQESKSYAQRLVSVRLSAGEYAIFCVPTPTNSTCRALKFSPW